MGSVVLAVFAIATFPLGTASSSVEMPGLVPAWATTSAFAGVVGPTEVVEAQLLLPWRDRSGVADFVRRVSDPASPDYGHYLTPDQFRARFAPTKETVDAARAWARRQGLDIGSIPLNRIVVPVRGTALAMGKAFETTFARYRVQGLALRAPMRPPSLPSSLRVRGITVQGLDQGRALIRVGGELAAEPAPSMGTAEAAPAEQDPPPELIQEPATPADSTPPNAVVYAPPCSKHHEEKLALGVPPVFGKPVPAVTCETTPAALRDAYGVSSLLAKGIDGSGQTIAMIGSHAIRPLVGDVNTWSGRHGVAPLTDGQLRQISYPGAYQTPTDPTVIVFRHIVWAVQSAMIMETMHTIAPGADLLYVGSTSSLDLPNATMITVDLGWADVVMNGWYSASEADGSVADDQQITMIGEQAAMTGISLIFASGDIGDGTKFGATSPGPAWPASNPHLITVGATSLILGPSGRYLREMGWAKTTRRLENGAWTDADDAFYRASGGGVSAKFDVPVWQEGVVPAGTTGRAVPDIAVTGDAETGMNIGYTQRFSDGSDKYSERRVAADTVATGLFAAVVALANDKKGANHGFINPALYSLAKASPQAYRDIVPSGIEAAGARFDYVDPLDHSKGTNALLKTFEQFDANKTRAGYDTSTGIGSPSTAFFDLLVPTANPPKQKPKVRAEKRRLPDTGLDSPAVLGLLLLICAVALRRRAARIGPR